MAWFINLHLRNLADWFVIKVSNKYYYSGRTNGHRVPPGRMQNRRIKQSLCCFCKNTCTFLCNANRCHPQKDNLRFSGMIRFWQATGDLVLISRHQKSCRMRQRRHFCPGSFIITGNVREGANPHLDLLYWWSLCSSYKFS